MAKYELNYEVLDEDAKKKGGDAEEFFDWVETIIFAFFTVILVFTFLLRIAVVSGESMLPTLQDKDRLIVSYLFYTPKNGDIVIVDCEDSILDKVIVKRVIATAGQTVDIDFSTGAVTVDGKVLDEPYINAPTLTDEGAFDFPITVPEGYYFVMGDNRNASSDSRHPYVGFIKKSQIYGKAIIRYAPLENFKTL